MRVRTRLLKVFVLFALFAAIAVPSGATTIVHVRGGSGYGPSSFSSGSGVTYSNCADGSFGNPCEDFQLAPFTVDINGLNYQVFQFTTLGPGNVLDVIEIGTVAANSTFTLPVSNSLLESGVFYCGNSLDSTTFGPSTTQVLDSGSTALTGLPCTPGFSSSPNISETAVSGGIQFKTGSLFNSLTLYTLDGNLESAVSTPEPGSLMLLGVGLLAIGRKFRRAS
jgi:hypothetical protein